VDRRTFLGEIHEAQFKPLPDIPRPLTAGEIAGARKSLRSLPAMPRQEPGTRPACALPYELAAHGALSDDRKSFVLTFSAGRELFGERAAGAPFHVCAPGLSRTADSAEMLPGRTRTYAVAAGERLEDPWPLANFPDGTYHLRVHGPNGFFREFRGSAADPGIAVSLEPVRTGGRPTGDLQLVLTSPDAGREFAVTVADSGYGGPARKLTLRPGVTPSPLLTDLRMSHGWYDLLVTVEGFPGFSQRFAGRLETGRETRTDPLMG
jgi:phospholipase C